MKQRRRIKILYTGGTIGSEMTDSGVLTPGDTLKQLLKDDIQELRRRQPEIESRQEYIPDYDFVPLRNILDSSNMGPREWNIIAKAIMPDLVGSRSKKYSGVLILHGTDTMAFTASALSFMLEGLQHCGKNVVITGSQIPYYKARTDARDQLVSAMMLAAHGDIPEVVLYFDKKALRGCRTLKYDSYGFSAFDSPGFPPLGTFGIEFTEDQNIKFARTKELFNLRAGFHKTKVHYLHFKKKETPRIGVIKLYPGITPESFELFAETLDGIIVEGFGAGNGPTSGEQNEFLEAFRRVCAEKIVLVITQCPKGFVSEDYGSGLIIAGGINGRDMTTEAALTKMHYLYSKADQLNWKPEEIKKRLGKNIVGELTPERDPKSSRTVFSANVSYS